MRVCGKKVWNALTYEQYDGNRIIDVLCALAVMLLGIPIRAVWDTDWALAMLPGAVIAMVLSRRYIASAPKEFDPTDFKQVWGDNFVRVWVVLNRRTGTVHSVTSDEDESLDDLKHLLDKYDGDSQSASRTVAVVHAKQRD